MDTFSDRLIAAIDRQGCPITVGFDPRLDLMPPTLVRTYFTRYGETHRAASLAIREFNLRLLDVLAPHIPAVKVQVAFYEAFGPAGMEVFADTLREARQRGLIVIADVKRGDIELTAQAYAAAYLGQSLPGVTLSPGFEADAITVNPYVGGDGILPFVTAAKSHGKGLFILAKTSNPTSGEVQNLLVDGQPLYERLASLIQQWGLGTEGKRGYQAVGAVVGATYRAEAARLRQLMPHTYFLVPGYGAQGAGAADVQACFAADGYGAIINSSRAILYAYRQQTYRAFGEEHFPEAARAAVLAMREGTGGCAETLVVSRPPLRLAVLLSGGGTTLQNLIDHIEAGKLSASIVVVISSHPDAYGLVRARRHGLEAMCLPWMAYRDAQTFDLELNRTLDRYAPELIALAGFLRVFHYAPHYRERVINIHPSLIPSFCGKGFYGMHVHQAVLAYGVKVSGCTVHFADEEYDHGPIIRQRVVPVLDHDTPESLAARVGLEERTVYPEVIQLFAEGRLQVQGRWVNILEAAPAPVTRPEGAFKGAVTWHRWHAEASAIPASSSIP